MRRKSFKLDIGWFYVFYSRYILHIIVLFYNFNFFEIMFYKWWKAFQICTVQELSLIHICLQSPLTPHALDFDCVGQNKSVVPPPPPPCLPLLINHHLAVVQPHRNPVGTNPHDINNPLSVNQLTGKCIKNSSSPSAGSSSATSSSKDSSSSSRPVISVT